MLWIGEHFLAVILTIATVFAAIWLVLLRKRLQMHPLVALLLAVAHTLYGVACVRVFAFMEGANSGAMSLFGAVFFMPVAYYIGAKLSKRPVGEVFDVFAIPMIVTLMLARCNCLASGCCLGRTIPGLSIRWPTRESEMLFYAVFLVLMIPRVWKGKTNGRLYPIYMISYGIFRAVIECFRESGSMTFFHLPHLWALIAIVIGLGVIFELQKHADKAQMKKKRSR